MVNVFFRALAFGAEARATAVLDLTRTITASVRAFGLSKRTMARADSRTSACSALDVDSVADMGRLQDWEDRVPGVTPDTGPERARKVRATKCERQCP